ncbi:IclR family transcriptional regulator [Ruegeria sp. R14_0]|uniref:IclR family transcriptional regulator n=1 Tax=Ruegeria sp. R14_0 TaxID=2821100 RepID=UPI001AD9BE3B|nr:IclR family transcriptional regulator [Ruegeria sp. R14_0]MBO9446395.1 IclR family transcriptional regulator [Ruegeria sp. R14_0]
MGTITKALDLLSHFARDRSEIGLGEFVRLTGRDKATVHRHLTELAENGFLEQHPDTRAYRLGPALLRLSALRETLFPVRKLLQPIVFELSEAVGELAHASLLQGDALSPVVHFDPSLHGIQVNFDISEMLPLHATSSGLAALAFCPDEWQTRVMSRPLARYTDQTISDPAVLKGKIDNVRRFGVATVTGGFDEGVTSVGVPLFGEGGRVLGSLAVAVPSVRAKPEKLRDIALKLLKEAKRASTALGGTFPRDFDDLPLQWGDETMTQQVIS